MRAIALVLLGYFFIVLAHESETSPSRVNRLQVFFVIGALAFGAMAIFDVVKSYF